MAEHCTKDDLINFRPRHEFFVGVDSDGCVFDTMEIKQKQCMHGLIVETWNLQPIEATVREAAEFVNLYSKGRGQNRFPALVQSIDLVRNRPEAAAAGVTLPNFAALRRWIDEEPLLGNPALERKVAATGDPELALVLRWSRAVNTRIAEVVQRVPPFQWVRESLEKLQGAADVMVVSQTPCEALIREWGESRLTACVAMIAGQELGTKADHIRMAAGGKYPAGRILMVGDAPGDLRAARANDALFYPVNPAHETVSWERFHSEACDRFLAGDYAGAYEAECIAAFEALLPDTPTGS